MWYAHFSRVRAGFSSLRRVSGNGKIMAVFCCALMACLLAACGGSPAASPSSSASVSPVTPTVVVAPTPTQVPPTPKPAPPTPAPVAQQSTAPKAAQSAPAPILDVAPVSMGINGHVDCKKSATVYTCQSAVISRASNQVAHHWTAYANIPGVGFSPAQGSVAPGTRVILTITIPVQECSGTFFYQGPINTHTIIWRC